MIGIPSIWLAAGTGILKYAKITVTLLDKPALKTTINCMRTWFFQALNLNRPNIQRICHIMQELITPN